MRVKVKQTEWILPVSHRHLQTPIKQSQHLSMSVLSHILDYKTYEANAVQNQLYSAFKTNTDIEQKESTITSDIIKLEL